MGIDPGLSSTGYAVLQQKEERIEWKEGGIIVTSGEDSLPLRLRGIYREMQVLLETAQPDVVVVEDLFTAYQNPTAAVLMGHARGVCLLAAGERDLPVVSYTATRVKKALTGNGRASKLQVKRMVKAVLGLAQAPSSEHMADAAAIALCFLWEQKAAGRAKVEGTKHRREKGGLSVSREVREDGGKF